MLRAILLTLILFMSVYSYQNFHHKNKDSLNVGLILPYTNFGVREYTRAINNAVSGLHRSRGQRLDWLKKYNFTPKNVHYVLITLTPSPTG
jgi:hypothetical protein